MSLFIQINTERDINKWMKPLDCDIRPNYSLSDIKGSYFEITEEDDDFAGKKIYRAAEEAGAVPLNELDEESDTCIFMFGTPTRISLESPRGYVSEMGCDPEDYDLEDDYDEWDEEDLDESFKKRNKITNRINGSTRKYIKDYGHLDESEYKAIRRSYRRKPLNKRFNEDAYDSECHGYLEALQNRLESGFGLVSYFDKNGTRLNIETDCGDFDVEYVPGEWVYVIHFCGIDREFTEDIEHTREAVNLIGNVVEKESKKIAGRYIR